MQAEQLLIIGAYGNSNPNMFLCTGVASTTSRSFLSPPAASSSYQKHSLQ